MATPKAHEPHERTPRVSFDREPGWRSARGPGNRPDWTKSFWFRTILALSLLVLVAGGVILIWNPQAAGVIIQLALSGIVLAAIIAGMAALRSRRSPDEQLRSSP